MGTTTLGMDVRVGLRGLRRAPTYTLTTLVTFVVAIGSVSAVYSAAKGLLLDRLPFPEPDRLVFVGEAGIELDARAWVTSRYVLDRVSAEVPDLRAVATYNIWEATLTGVGQPRRLSGAVVTSAYFDALGRAPTLGRTFLPEDDADGAPRRVVISHRLWVSRFGADPSVLGRVVLLSGIEYEVVGVMPADFETPDEYSFASGRRRPPDVWRTFRAANTQLDPGNRSYRGVARLAEGATLTRARAQVDALRARIGIEHPEWAERSRIRIVPLQAQFTSQARPTIYLLLVGVGFVLIAACANVMGLTMARGVDRAADLRVRVALGAGRGSLVRQMVTETLLVGLIGGALGLMLAALGVEAFLASARPDVPRIDAIRLDLAVVPVVAGVTLFFAVVSGVLPSYRLLWGRHSLVGRMGGRGQSLSRGQRRTLGTFSVVQISLAVVLLVGAGHLLRSLADLVSVDPGYDPRGVLVAQLDLPESRYPEPADRRRAFADILGTLRGDPVVAEAGLVTSVPQHGLNNFSLGVRVPGTDGDGPESPWARYRGVSPGYVAAMGLRVVEGRMIGVEDWTEDESGDLHLAGIAVNEDFVRRWLPPGTPAVGTMVDMGGMAGAGELPIVGVVADVKYDAPDASDEPEIYLPVTGRFFTVFLVARGRGEPGPVADRMRAVVQSVDPTIPMDDVFRQERLLASATAQLRTTLALLAGLAVFALVLGAVGLYGVVSHGVARRAREFGIRMAMGAGGRSVLVDVLREGGLLAVTGGVLGSAGAFVAARTLGGLPGGVAAYTTDPLALVGAVVVVLTASLLATWVPARRATRVSPIDALRRE